MSRVFHRQEKRAFTMIELMVAMVVLIMLILMLATIVDSATKLWRENESRVDAYREARSALTLIAGDLRSMLVTTNTNYFSTNPIGGSPQFLEGSGLYFLTGMSGDAQPAGNKSDLCTVGYFRRWTKQNSGFGQTNSSDPTREGYQLFRTVYGSDITYSNLIVSNAVPLTNLADPTWVKPEILARNICSMDFRFYQTNGQTNTPGFIAWTTNSTNAPLPQIIEVRITAISDDLAKKLAGDRTRWTTNDALVKRNMRSFVARVQIPGLSTNQ